MLLTPTLMTWLRLWATLSKLPALMQTRFALATVRPDGPQVSFAPFE